MNGPTIETFAPGDAGRATVRAVTHLLQETWPKADFDEPTEIEQRFVRWRAIPLADVFARVHVMREGDRVVAHAHTAAREIRTTAGPMWVLALTEVCVRPDRRNHGLGSAIVRAALEPVDNGTLPFGLWQTDDARPLYERLGAVVIHNRFVNSLNEADPEASPWWNAVIMRYPDGPGWPEGVIDLRGPGY